MRAATLKVAGIYEHAPELPSTANDRHKWAGGRSPIVLAPADAKRFGLPTVAVLAGRVTFSFDSGGNLTSLSLHGHVLVDVCAALS
jgi:hypothetical protein